MAYQLFNAGEFDRFRGTNPPAEVEECVRAIIAVLLTNPDLVEKSTIPDSDYVFSWVPTTYVTITYRVDEGERAIILQRIFDIGPWFGGAGVPTLQ